MFRVTDDGEDVFPWMTLLYVAAAALCLYAAFFVWLFPAATAKAKLDTVDYRVPEDAPSEEIVVGDLRRRT